MSQPDLPRATWEWNADIWSCRRDIFSCNQPWFIHDSPQQHYITYNPRVTQLHLSMADPSFMLEVSAFVWLQVKWTVSVQQSQIQQRTFKTGKHSKWLCRWHKFVQYSLSFKKVMVYSCSWSVALVTYNPPDSQQDLWLVDVAQFWPFLPELWTLTTNGFNVRILSSLI